MLFLFICVVFCYISLILRTPLFFIVIFGFARHMIRPKKKKCVFPVTSKKKIRVGRSLLIFFILNFCFLFSLILPRNTTNVLIA